MLQTKYKDQEEGLSEAVEEQVAEAGLKGLRLYDGKNQIDYDIPIDKTFTIGRASGNDIVVPLRPVSNFHCRIEKGVYLFDGNSKPSTNGTYVNGKRVRVRKILRPGDEITLADPNSIYVSFFVHKPGEEF